MEAAICYGLERMRIHFQEDACLEKLIGLARDRALLPQGEALLGQVIRNYRNFIHPRKRMDEKRKMSRETAEMVKKACEYVLSELEKQLASYTPISMSGFLQLDGETIFIHKTPFTLGRGDDNSYVIHSSNVSKNHARITLVKDQFYLEDLGSTNGTYVLIDNRKPDKLKPNKTVPLCSGTRFRLGKQEDDSKFTFVIAGEDRTEREN